MVARQALPAPARQKTRPARRMAPPLAEARTLVNWLSTRVEARRGSALGVAPDHAYEGRLVASRLARACQLGLVVVPGAYTARAKGGVGETRDERDEQDQVERVATHEAHLVRCGTCDLSYRATHLHCCVCGQVFKSASAFERHAAGAGGRCATAEQLRRRHLRLGADGVWRREPPHTLAG